MPEDSYNLAAFLVQAVITSLSGVLAPGPMTAAAMAAATRRPHAGALIALGHAVIEFPLMFLILAGIGSVFEMASVKIGIGLVGGVFLLLMGVGILRSLPSASSTAASQPTGRGPFVTGIILTAGNPYFLLWWATVGLALATQAASLGVLAFVIFAVLHWLCDLVWMETLTLATFKGSRLLGGRGYRIILVICAIAMLLFGARFLYDAGGKLL